MRLPKSGDLAASFQTFVQKMAQNGRAGDLKFEDEANLCMDRLMHGRDVTKSLLDILEKRIKLEEDYAAKLARLNKLALETTGSMNGGLRQYYSSNEEISNIHREIKEAFIISHKDMSIFSQGQEMERKPLSDRVRDASKNLINTKVKLAEAQNEEKMKEEKVVKLTMDIDAGGKSAAKLQKTRDKTAKDLENIGLVRQQCLRNYEIAEMDWQNASQMAIEKFDVMEEKRLHNTRCLLWRAANIQSAGCIAIDKECTKLRQSLRSCHISKDLDDFKRATFPRNSVQAPHKRPLHHDPKNASVSEDRTHSSSPASQREQKSQSQKPRSASTMPASYNLSEPVFGYNQPNNDQHPRGLRRTYTGTPQPQNPVPQRSPSQSKSRTLPPAARQPSARISPMSDDSTTDTKL